MTEHLAGCINPACDPGLVVIYDARCNDARCNDARCNDAILKKLSIKINNNNNVINKILVSNRSMLKPLLLLVVVRGFVSASI